MIAMLFMDPPGVKNIEVDDAIHEQLDDDQRHRLHKARSSAFIMAKFVDTIPAQELEERLEEEEKKDAVRLLEDFEKKDFVYHIDCCAVLEWQKQR